jgi:hypothetical protein
MHEVPDHFFHPFVWMARVNCFLSGCEEAHSPAVQLSGPAVLFHSRPCSRSVSGIMSYTVSRDGNGQISSVSHPISAFSNKDTPGCRNNECEVRISFCKVIAEGTGKFLAHWDPAPRGFLEQLGDEKLIV